MNSKEFFYLVAQMRQAQREYFKERSQVKLRACKALEGECDREIFRVKQLIIDEDRRNAVCNKTPSPGRANEQ